jgi:Transposase DDE domain
MMKTSEGSLQYCYNGQVAANEDCVIVANEVTTSPLDVQQLVPMVEEIQATTGRKPSMVVADAGYLSEQNLKLLRKKRQRCLVAVRGRKQTRWPRGSETQRMHRLLRLPWAKKIYRTRKTQGERPFAEIKQTMRFRRFATRGRANIRGEWELVCAAANALTLYRAATA